MSTIRTFVAIVPSAEVRARASNLIDRLRQPKDGVKWVAPSAIHWTLKFLGDVAAEDIPEVCRRVESGVSPLRAFDVHVRGLGAFPTTKRPRTLWLGVGRGEQEMVNLQQAIESQLAELGFRKEGRRYVPHLTLGRVKQSLRGSLSKDLEQYTDYEAATSRIDEVIVFSSRLSPAGPEYDPLGRAKLGDF